VFVRAAGLRGFLARRYRGSMTVIRLADTTWERIRDLDPRRAVAILPTGATEAHGPHLPMDTDVTIAESMATAGAERLSAGGRVAVILPALAYTSARFAADFPGTIDVSPRTVNALIVDIARSLARSGFETLAIANSHFDPDHLGAVHEATKEIRDLGILSVAFPDVTRKPWGSRLTEEFRSGACHAGRYEGSMVLARSPEKVDLDIMLGLPPIRASLSEAIRDGKTSFAQAGGERAYFGSPGEASAEEGVETIGILGDILAEAVEGITGTDESDE